MAKEIKFKKTTVDLIRRLTAINPSILIEKETPEDGDPFVFIKSSDASGSVAYSFKAPVEHFSFTGTDVGFLDFNEFHQLLSVYKEPKIFQDDDDALDLLIKENRSKISYRLTNSEVIKRGFDDIEFSDPDVEFTITSDDVAHLNKMMSLVNAESVNITVSESKVKVTLSSKKSSNTFEEIYDADTSEDKDFEINISKDTFAMLPRDNYKIALKEEGIIRFTMVRDDEAAVEIFVAEESND